MSPDVPLTSSEADTLDTVRALRPTGRNVRTLVVIDRNRVRGLTYDQTHRALAGLVRKGHLVKHARGWYALASDGEGRPRPSFIATERTLSFRRFPLKLPPEFTRARLSQAERDGGQG